MKGTAACNTTRDYIKSAVFMVRGKKSVYSIRYAEKRRFPQAIKSTYLLSLNCTCF